jgi:hypothetical protein
MREELKPCPFCGETAALTEDNDPMYRWQVRSPHSHACFLAYSNANRHRSYETPAEAITAWNTRAAEVRIATLEGALRKQAEFVDNYFSPWGAWKTEWWEGEVSGHAAFSDGNALKHLANMARATLSPEREG